MTGFLAQDVEEAARLSHYDFSGVQKPADLMNCILYGILIS